MIAFCPTVRSKPIRTRCTANRDCVRSRGVASRPQDRATSSDERGTEITRLLTGERNGTGEMPPRFRGRAHPFGPFGSLAGHQFVHVLHGFRQSAPAKSEAAPEPCSRADVFFHILLEERDDETRYIGRDRAFPDVGSCSSCVRAEGSRRRRWR